MRLEATPGNYLTENFAVEYSQRRFQTVVHLSSSDEAKYWKEITPQQMAAIKAQQELLEVSPENLNYEFLSKASALYSGIRENVNKASLTGTEALSVKDLYPRWETLFGEPATVGFRFLREDTLMEVVQAHTFTQERDPLMEVSMLPADGDEQAQYYKPVTSEIELY